MNKKTFDSRIAELKAMSELSPTEQAYIQNIDEQIQEKQTASENAKKRMHEIDIAAYCRFSAKRTESEEIEYNQLQKLVRATPGQINALVHQKKNFPDEYRDLIEKREKAFMQTKNAAAAVKTAEDDLTKAQDSYCFDEIVKCEKSVLIAKATQRAAEDAYKAVCDEVKGFIPVWQTDADMLRMDITEDAKTGIREAFTNAIKTANEAVERLQTLHAVEDLFDITGEGKAVYGIRFSADCGWLLSLVHTIETMMPRED